jgi:hypothetical protein
VKTALASWRGIAIGYDEQTSPPVERRRNGREQQPEDDSTASHSGISRVVIVEAFARSTMISASGKRRSRSTACCGVDLFAMT